jgi:hypothetical protein
MTTNKEIVKALSDIAPNTEWSLAGDEIDNLVWLDESPTPSKEAILAAIANPLPVTEPTVAEKLASVGLSIEELKTELGL